MSLCEYIINLDLFKDAVVLDPLPAAAHLGAAKHWEKIIGIDINRIHCDADAAQLIGKDAVPHEAAGAENNETICETSKL